MRRLRPVRISTTTDGEGRSALFLTASPFAALTISPTGSGVGAAACGFVLGLALCIGALRALRSAIYGVGVYDATTIVAVVLGLAVVTLIATAMPALRIARIDPASALRGE